MGNIKSNALNPALKTEINTALDMASLPVIRGSWFYVDPTSGSDNASGSSIEEAVASIESAYEKCTSGAGDGIVVFSRGTSSAATTSYLKQELAWTKHGITVIGIASPVGIYGRARIANQQVTTGELTDLSFTNSGTADYISRVTGSFITDGFEVGQKINVDTTSNTNDGNYTISAVEALKITLSASDSLTTENAATAGATTIKSYNVQLITVSGSNNIFVNLTFWNGGALAAELGGVKVTGARNYFGKCHIVGGAGCTATANERSLELGDGAQENVFDDCVIGTDTVDRGNNANCELLIAGTVANTARNSFSGCHFLSMADGGTAHGAIKSSAATSMGRNMIMKNCTFENYRPNLGADQASVFIGTAFNTAKIFLTGKPEACGYAEWDASASNNVVFVSQAATAASAGGGLMTVK